MECSCLTRTMRHTVEPCLTIQSSLQSSLERLTYATELILGSTPCICSVQLIGTEQVQTGQWVGACFLYTNEAGRLNYYVGGEVMTLCHLDHPMYMLGYLPKEDRVYLMDKTQGIHRYCYCCSHDSITVCSHRIHSTDKSTRMCTYFV
jgi:Coatomer WD associated region